MANTRTRKINQNVELNTTYDFVANDGTFSGTITGDSFVGPLTGDVTGTVSSLSNHDTTDLAEGTNLYFTTARARAAFSAGTGVNITSGVISIGQSVSTASDVTFGSVTATTFEGALTGDVTGNADTASALEAAVNIALTGSVTGNVDFDGSGNVSITTTTTHNHDDRYYTETESDGKYLLNTTDTLDGNLTITGDLNVTGTIDLSNADLNIGAADIIFDTTSTGATRGLMWNVSDSGILSKIIGGGTDGGKVTLFANMDDAIISGNIFEIKDGSLGSLFLGLTHNGALIAGGGTSTQWNTAYTYSQVGHLPLTGGTLTGGITVTAGEGREVATYLPASYTTGDLVSGHEYGWYNDHWRLGMTRSGSSSGADFVVQWNGSRRLSLTNGGNLTVTGTLSASGYNKSNWDTAFGWGNHDGLYSLVGHTHDLIRHSLAAPAYIDTMTSTSFRTSLFGSNTNGYAISTSRWNTTPPALSGMNSYGTLFAWSGADTHGFIATDYSTANIQVGGGYGDNVTWKATLIHSGNIGSQSVANASTLDSLDSTQFLRSDVADTMGAQLTINSGSFNPLKLDRTSANNVNMSFFHQGILKGYLGIGSTGDLSWGLNADSAQNNTIIHAGNIANQSVANASTLDSIDSSQFLRSDESDTMNGNLDITGRIKLGGYSYIGEDLSDNDSLTIAYDVTESLHFATHTPATGVYDTKMILTPNGKVGIGTTSPSAPLHVYKSDTYSAIISRGDWNSGTPTKLALGKQYGTLAFISTDLVETTNDTSYIALNYKSGLSTFAEGLRVNNNGNVGIGNTSPAYKLDVAGNARISGGTIIQADAGNEQLVIARSSNGSEQLIIGFHSSDYGRIQAVEQGVGYRPLALNQDGGNVGIGTTSPDDKLDVNGRIRARQGFAGTDGSAKEYYWHSENTGNSGTIWRKIGRYNAAGQSSRIMITAVGTASYSGGQGSGKTTLIAQVNNNNLLEGSFWQEGMVTQYNSFGIVSNSGSSHDIYFQVPSYSEYAFEALVSDGTFTTDATTVTPPTFTRIPTREWNVNANLWVNSSNNVGIGTSGPAYKLDVSGDVRATGDVLAYSDARVKENVETIDNALDKVVAMRGVSYNRTDSDDKTKKVGVIAQEIQKVLPEVVSEQEYGMLSVSYGNIVGVLIEAIKELKAEIDELKKQK